jgi:hypothetical protein
MKSDTPYAVVIIFATVAFILDRPAWLGSSRRKNVNPLATLSPRVSIMSMSYVGRTDDLRAGNCRIIIDDCQCRPNTKGLR